MTKPLRIDGWPRAICHVDCDAFFASVEQAIHPELKGKPVITGAERGIVAAASYEAKALGVQRGMPLGEVKRVCPNIIMLQSDYETYSIFSKRLFEIMRRFTPIVEEYSIDEAFGDLTGLRRVYRCGYEDIGRLMQNEVHKELGITVSVGISLSKSLAKLCSKFRKPAGLTAVRGRHIHHLLKQTPIEKVWGIGPATTALLKKHRIHNAMDFVTRPKSFAEKLLGKIGLELWMELNGEYAYKLTTEEKHTYASISKAKTFTPASSDPHYVFAQALRNLESACIKARRYNLAAKKFTIYLRDESFTSSGEEVLLNRPTASPIELTAPLKETFAKLFHIGRRYRQTGIILSDLKDASLVQFSLFEDPLLVTQAEDVSDAIDEINTRFGKHTIFMAEGLCLNNETNTRLRSSKRSESPLRGETERQHLRIPLLDYKVT